MKKLFIITVFLFAAAMQPANGQVFEVIKMITEAVIKAMDLKVQRMQNEVINLQIAQKQAENALSKKGLDDIANVSENQKELYKKYFASLKQVKQTVSNSTAVIKVLQQQKALVVLYNIAISASNKDTHLTPTEKLAFTKACASFIDEGATTINTLEQTLRNNYIQATDADRLKLIMQSANQLEGLLYKLQTIYTRQQNISLSRTKSEKESQAIKDLYGLKE
jgi:predicted transcriptional regulator YheO